MQAECSQSLHRRTQNMAGMDGFRLVFFFYQGQIVPALTTIIVNWLCCTIVLLCYCALFVPQVSMEVCHEISVEMTKSPSSPPPSPKKGKGKAQKSKAVSPGIEDFLELT